MTVFGEVGDVAVFTRDIDVGKITHHPVAAA
jgi:hypothetical protein